MISRGILFAGDLMAAAGLVEAARGIEALGYDSLWLPELFGREPVATAGFLLGRTERIRLATGIANVYVRDAHAMAQTRRTLSELSDGRFLLGLGVSNPGVNGARGHTWQPPVEKVTSYLDAMEAAAGPGSDAQGPFYLAAHGPKLQALAAERTNGVITYLMPPEHTRATRARIGHAAELNVVCPLLAEPDPDRARAVIRSQLKVYLTLDYYHREWRKLGLGDADFADGGSDRLVDTIVGWGDAAALDERITAYEQAGATRVIVMPLDLQRSRASMATVESVAPRA